ncbi:hypothetical protein EVAR_10090_1 [Eumeta japonica]|uniref:Uncharacterized protein n=1 Tax=Eumeta variegata TaxID=151549 RepID=A0A4C1UCA6_EUMVA|nr:hypothetical protein EVAR_10090_1 [Eumeta japonica]
MFDVVTSNYRPETDFTDNDFLFLLHRKTGNRDKQTIFCTSNSQLKFVSSISLNIVQKTHPRPDRKIIICVRLFRREARRRLVRDLRTEEMNFLIGSGFDALSERGEKIKTRPRQRQPANTFENNS